MARAATAGQPPQDAAPEESPSAGTSIARSVAIRAAASLGGSRSSWAMRLAARTSLPDHGIHPALLAQCAASVEKDGRSTRNPNPAEDSRQPTGAAEAGENTRSSSPTSGEGAPRQRTSPAVLIVSDLLQTLLWCLPMSAAGPLLAYVSSKREALGLRGAVQARIALEAVSLFRQGKEWEAVFMLLGGPRGLRSPAAALEIAFGLEPRLDCWRGVLSALLSHCEREGLECAADCSAALRIARDELSRRLPAADMRVLVPPATGGLVSGSSGEGPSVPGSGGGSSSYRRPESDPAGMLARAVELARGRARVRSGVLALSGMEKSLAARYVALWNALEAADASVGADDRALAEGDERRRARGDSGHGDGKGRDGDGGPEDSLRSRHAASVAQFGVPPEVSAAAAEQGPDGSSHGEDVVDWDVSPVRVEIDEEYS